ncbi:PASTA domain-containing protein [Nonomuraea fastidiosa]|uniref:PASTA domain-containing protein n=1 Tax=Nonomuraea TaxID=83681 RepID=UPI00324EE30C
MLGAGAGAVALTGITGTPAEPTQTTSAVANQGDGKEGKPKTSRPPKTRTAEPPTREPEPTRAAEQTVNRPYSPKPSVTRSTPVATEEPAKTPTTTPSTSPTPSKSPSASPTVKKVLVPNVVGRRLLEAQGMIEAAGLQPVIEDRTTTTDGRRCGRIKQTTPGPGKAVDKGTEIKMVLIDSVCPEDSPPETPTPTPTPSKAP